MATDCTDMQFRLNIWFAASTMKTSALDCPSGRLIYSKPWQRMRNSNRTEAGCRRSIPLKTSLSTLMHY